MTTEQKQTLVIYHKDCTDGFTAAWCAWLKYGDSAEYLPAKYGDDPPDVTGRDVLIVDFSYPVAQLKAMLRARSLTIFDHHKTAQADLIPWATQFTDPRLRVVFDMERSGAGIAWDELHNQGLISKSSAVAGFVEFIANATGVINPHNINVRPWLVDYVEDRDLWRFVLPHSKEVNEFLHAQEKTFERWDEINQYDTVGFAAQAGATLLQATMRYVESMREHTRMRSIQIPTDLYLKLSGKRMAAGMGGDGISCVVPIINCPPHAASDLLGALADGSAFAVGWFQRGDGMYQYSLRSRGEQGVDVSAIAKEFGGGGHKNAAGFAVKDRVDV